MTIVSRGFPSSFRSAIEMPPRFPRRRCAFRRSAPSPSLSEELKTLKTLIAPFASGRDGKVFETFKLLSLSRFVAILLRLLPVPLLSVVHQISTSIAKLTNNWRAGRWQNLWLVLFWIVLYRAIPMSNQTRILMGRVTVCLECALLGFFSAEIYNTNSLTARTIRKNFFQKCASYFPF